MYVCLISNIYNLKKLLFFTSFLLYCYNLNAQAVFINELHYDNNGGDVNEGWEISGPAGTDLSCYDIVLYNGNGGASYNTITLSGTISDSQCGFGTLSFLTSGIQNGNPDGIALYNTCTSTLIQFLSYGGTFTATNGVVNGNNSTDIGITENGSSTVGHSLQLIGNGTTYTDFTWQTSASSSMGTINNGQAFCVCPGLSTQPINQPNTLSSTATSCFEGNSSWTLGTDAANVLVVISTSIITGSPTDGTAYIANSNFGSGSTLNTGEFIVYSGSSNTINITGLSENTTYYITTFSYNGTIPGCEENYLHVGVSSTFNTLSGCAVNGPQITSILFNSCNGNNEGTDEIFTFTTGTTPINIDDILIEYPFYDYCNSGCGSNTNINNPTYITNLNTLAGCTVFAYADPIPAGSDVMVFTGSSPSTVLDYSAQCGSSNLPIYVIFNNNTNISGRFGNNAIRTLIVSFGGGLTDTVTYDANVQADTDGSTVNFDAAGNPTYFFSNDCVYPLPIELLYFKAEIKDNYTKLKWATTTERNNNYFNIQKSLNGYDFSEIGNINGAGNSTQIINYIFTEDIKLEGLAYYRLKQVDYNGNISYSPIIKSTNSTSLIYYNNNQIHFNMSNSQVVNFYNLNGQLIKSKSIDHNQILDWHYKGFYIIEIPELQYRNKIICY